MEKSKFYDVFPMLNLYGDIADIFENVEEYTGQCFTKDIKMPVALKYKTMTTEQKVSSLRNIVYNEFNTHRWKKAVPGQTFSTLFQCKYN